MPDNGCSIVAAGASAGGVEALQRFAHLLPPDFPAPTLVVLHASPMGRSRLPDILTRAGRPPAMHARDNAPIEAGWIYVAPPDLHRHVSPETDPDGTQRRVPARALRKLHRTCASSLREAVRG